MAKIERRLAKTALGYEQKDRCHIEESSAEDAETMTVTFTKEELREFDRLTGKLSSVKQMDRIDARLQLPKFIEKYGKEKCDAMFEELQRRDRKHA